MKPAPAIPPPPLHRADLLKRWQISASTFRRRRKAKWFPKPLKLSRSLWAWNDIVALESSGRMAKG